VAKTLEVPEKKEDTIARDFFDPTTTTLAGETTTNFDHSRAIDKLNS
jgi:hypothetical protein